MAQQTIDLGQLSVEQLAQIKSQLDSEIEHLTNSFATLKAAEARFRRGKEAIEALPAIGEGKRLDSAHVCSGDIESTAKPALIPLTASLYVEGKLQDPDSVIVDVGTGYYVQKNLKEAKTYYNTKVLDLRKQTDQLQPVIEKKQEDRSVITNILQQRLSEREKAKASDQGTAD